MPKQSYRAEEQVRWAFLCLEAIAKGPSKEIRHFTFLEATYKSFSLDHLFVFNCLYLLFFMFCINANLLSLVKQYNTKMSVFVSLCLSSYKDTRG